MADVASASVSLIPTFAGGARKIESAMGPALERAGATGGQRYGDSFAGAVLASPAVRQLAAAGGIGAILFAGINRVKAIDTAQAKLRGLGNDAQRVDQIMQNALASVKGTAFGLGDAVTVAAQLSAAQIPAGVQLERTLKSVANAAAASGSSLGEMGSIYAKVASLNKAQNDSLQQVADRGIPIYQALADQLGVTADEVFKMASAGKIGFAEFAAAMTTASGTVADELGQTIQGRIDNTLAAVGRLGAGLAGGPLTQGADSLSQLTKAIDSLTPAATVLGNAAGSVLGVLNAIPAPVYAGAAAFVALRLATRSTAFGNITTGVTGAVASFRSLRLEAQLAGAAMPGVTAGLAGVSSAGRAAGAALLGAFGGPVGLAIGGVSLAVGGLISLWQQGEQAAADQKSAVDALTASLDANTGATTNNTAATVASQLENVLPILDKLGIGYKGLASDIANGDPEGKVAALRKELQALASAEADVDKPIWEFITESLNGTQGAKDALKGIDTVLGNVESALKLTEQGIEAVGAEAETLPPAFKSVGEAIDAAFSGVSGLAGETSAIQGLAQSILDNGNAINTSTSGGIANLQALQSTISAMADASGGDYTRFANQVGGLMVTLQQQGVNTQGVMGAVRAAVENVAGKRYGVFLDGSQAIAEANRVILSQKKMLVALQVARAAAIGGPAAALTISFAGVAMAAFDAAIRGVSTSAGNVGSTFRGVSQAASGAGKSAGKAASATKAAGKSARETAADLAALRSELYATARAWLAPSPMSSEASSLIDQINGAYSDKAISKTVRSRLVKAVTDRDKQMRGIATSREKLADQIDDANGKLQDAIEARTSFRDSIVQGFRELGDLTRFAEQTEKTVTETFRQGDRLYNVSRVVKGVSSAKDMVQGLRDQVSEATKFKAAFDQLNKLGLNDTSLQNLMSQFLSTGESATASSLLQGGKSAVNEVNGLMKSLTGLTGGEKGWAANVAQDMFGAGVNAADGFLKGLKSKDAALNKQYKSISANLLGTIKKDLGIRSPSRRMAELAGYTSDGWNQNLHLDPVTPDVAVPGVGSSGGGPLGGAGELWLMVDGEPIRAVVRTEMSGEAAARLASRRGGRR